MSGKLSDILKSEKSKLIDEEISKRLKSKNAFRANSGPPDYSGLKKLFKRSALENREVIGELDSTVEKPSYELKQSGNGELFFTETPVAEASIAEDSKIEELFEPQIVIPAAPISKPYTKGDNIFIELLDYYQSDKISGKKSTAVIEEDHNCLLATVAAASRLSLIIEGPSRSGKSLIADKLGDILTSVYKVEICSNKALFSDADEINRNDFMYISEFQAVLENNPDVKETIKLLTEHKSATNKANGKAQTLDGKITIISTGADENARTQKRDVEVSGRFILLRTRSDYEKIKRIAEYQDSILMGEKVESDYSVRRYDNLKSHLKNILLSNFCFENSFARAYSQWLPETQKSIHCRTLFTSLINGFTMFDEPNRIQKGDKLLTNLSDVYLVHALYHPTYCDALKKLSAHSYNSVEKVLPEIERVQRLKTLEDELALVEKAVNTPVDWQSVWNAGYCHMKEKNPSQLDEWVGLQTKGSEVVVYDPIKHQDLRLCGV